MEQKQRQSEYIGGDQVTPAQWKWVVALLLVPTIGLAVDWGMTQGQLTDHERRIANAEKTEHRTDRLEVDVSAIRADVNNLQRAVDRNYDIQQKILEKVSK